MSQLDPIAILLIVLATWRSSYMLTSEAGPYAVFTKLRTATNGAGGLLTCIKCLSVWAAAAMVVLWWIGGAGQIVVLVLALSGGALMLQAYTGVNHGA